MSSSASPPAQFRHGSALRVSGCLVKHLRLIVGDGNTIENAAFLVEGEAFTWVGSQGQRQPPQGATRVDLSGKTVMPSLIDGHNHIGLINEKDGSNSKANYRREILVDVLQRYAYYGVAATLSMGLEADQELAYELRDQVIPNATRFLTVGKGIAATPIGGPTGEPRLGIPYGARTATEGRDHVRELHMRGVRFVKIWVDDRNGDVPKLQPSVYRAIVAEAHANGMEVLAHDPFISEQVAATMGAELVSLDDLCARSDYITLHIPATAETRNLFDATRLACWPIR